MNQIPETNKLIKIKKVFKVNQENSKINCKITLIRMIIKKMMKKI